MPRKNRKPEILSALALKGADPIKVAEQFGVSRPYVYHLDKKRREGFAAYPGDKVPKRAKPGGGLFTELSVSSLKRHGGDVAEEYLRELQGTRGVELYKEMSNDPVIAAVLHAIKMTLRRIPWYAVAPASGREEEVDFVNQCMEDMSLTWADFIDQALSMLQYGYAPFEIVYKLRKGDGAGRPGPRMPASRFDDGKIGWRKFCLIGQDTLAPGNNWWFDENDGSLKGVNQQQPIGTPVVAGVGRKMFVTIPIEKMILFRTTTEKGNPEGRSILRPMYGCFSADTDILTLDGWKTAGQISEHDKVATLNPDTNAVEYERPSKVHIYPYSGDLIHAHSKFVDQLVTPNHRMWVRRTHKDNYEFIEADQCNPTVSFSSTARWNAPDIEGIQIGEHLVDADTWFEFLGFWLSEGCAYRCARNYNVNITQMEGAVADKIRAVVAKLPWSCYEKTDKTGKIQWTFTRKELWENLQFLGKSKSRYAPDYVFQASSRQINILLDAYYLGDGSLAGDPHKWDGTRLIFTASKEMADDLMELVLKGGHRPSLRWQKGTGFGPGVWVVTVGKPFDQMWTKWESVPYSGIVWCVTTKNGIVYSRRNGKASWSGNSWFYAKNMTEIESISAERMGAGFPVIYLGEDISKGQDADAEIAEYRKLGRNIRIDEQMCAIIPSGKMGHGAREGTGVLLEFLSPNGRANVNFGQIIERHERRMAMTGLAQMIHLGMGQYGSQSLADVTTDFFSLAVSGWADSMRDVINRFATIPLLRLNNMDLKDPVIIEHGQVSPPSLSDMADYINKTVGAKVIEPDDQLEAALRRTAGLPEKDPTTTRAVMVEVDGDGGTRMNRSEKTTVDTAGSKRGVKAGQDGKPANQRNMRPTAKGAKPAKTPTARKPMRASDETDSDDFDE